MASFLSVLVFAGAAQSSCQAQGGRMIGLGLESSGLAVFFYIDLHGTQDEPVKGHAVCRGDLEQLVKHLFFDACRCGIEPGLSGRR